MKTEQKKEIENLRKALFEFRQASMQLAEMWSRIGNECTPDQADQIENAMSSAYPFEHDFMELETDIFSWYANVDDALTEIETGAAEVDQAHVEQVINDHLSSALDDLCREYGIADGVGALDWGFPEDGDADAATQELSAAFAAVLKKTIYLYR